jgi:penicillin amidase
VAALPAYASFFPGTAMPGLDASRHAEAVADPLFPGAPPPYGASNAWAAAPSRSSTGSTLLAADPHLPFTAPTLWYLARLDLTSGGVIGATIPGIPAVLQGRSEVFGWGQTAAYIDDQDLHVERLNPDRPTPCWTAVRADRSVPAWDRRRRPARRH